MSDTPETDAAWACFKGYTEPLQDVQDLSRKLERERDEAREDLQSQRELYKVQEQYLETARAELSLKCQSVTIASGTISDLIKESERLEKQIEGLNNFANERFDEIQRVRRERDEAITRRMETIMQCELYEQERDEAVAMVGKLTQRGVEFMNEHLALQRERRGLVDKLKEAVEISSEQAVQFDRLMVAMGAEELTIDETIALWNDTRKERDEVMVQNAKLRDIAERAMLFCDMRMRDSLRAELEQLK